MNTYRIVYTSKSAKIFPIVIRVEDTLLEHVRNKALHLKDSMSQLGIIPQNGVRTDVKLEFRNGKKIRSFQS